MQRYCVRTLLLAALAALSGACGGGDGGGGGGPIGPDDEPVATVSVTAPAGQIVPGQTKQLAVVLRDAAGEELTGRAVTFSSTSDAIARVSTTGLVTAVGTGRATITATSETKTGTVAIDVVEGALIGPAGGTVTALDGELQLVVPAGALAAETAITVEAGGTLPADPSAVLGSRVVLGPQATTFAVPAQLRLPFDPTQGPSGVAETDFRLHRVQGLSLQSLGGTVDAGADRVSAEVNQLGTFAVGRAQPTVPCMAPEHRQFDFWVGEWTIMIGGLPGGPPSVVTSEPGGCAIFENFNSGAGRSINVFNPADGMWHQTFAFRTGGPPLILIGGLEGEEMVLFRTPPFPAGSIERWTWTVLPGGSVRQLAETSTDGGQTFQAGFDGTYVPR